MRTISKGTQAQFETAVVAGGDLDSQIVYSPDGDGTHVFDAAFYSGVGGGGWNVWEFSVKPTIVAFKGAYPLAWAVASALQNAAWAPRGL